MTRSIGSSGWEVQPVGLGGMPMSIQGRPDKARSMDTLRAAFEAGVDLVDTADVYCLDDGDLGHNERLVAEGLLRYGGGRAILVATKGGCTRPGGRWERDGRPEHLHAACERSLRALGIERIELYQLHAVDPRVPLEESVGALAELRRQGKIAHVGLSNVTVEQVERARAIVPVVSVQNRLNPLEVGALRSGLVEHCAHNGIAFLAYSPVGGRHQVARLSAHPALARIGSAVGATGPEVALAWLLAQSPAIVPIPGASRPESIRSSVSAARIALSAAQIAELDQAFLAT